MAHDMASRQYVAIVMLAVVVIAIAVACGGSTSEPSPEPTATQEPPPATATPDPGPTEVPPTPTPRPQETAPTATVSAPESTATPSAPETGSVTDPVTPKRDFDVITLLPPDAIPAISNPGFYSSLEDANESYADDDLVLGIEINGDARAYLVPLLSRHEIVNDVVGGEPVAVTW